MSVKAVVFDLDDTLYPERDYVKSGFKAVARVIEDKYGFKNTERDLNLLFLNDRNGVFDRYLKKQGIPRTEQNVGELLDVYRYHKPNIKLTEEVRQTLTKLHADGYKLGVITDGRPAQQRLKISALGLNELVDRIILTDELGGIECRKPNPTAFEVMAQDLGVKLDEMIYVGDNPEKDFAIGSKGVKTIRLNNNGIYANCDYRDGIKENYSISEMKDIFNYKELTGPDEHTVIKKLLLHIMDFIHDVCVKENIQYSLSGGTLIGAIRHKGFIPWDDDIDVTMERAHFDKFAQVIDSYCEKSGEFILTRNTLRVPVIAYRTPPVVGNKKYDGVKIDIFILDNFPDGNAKRRRLIFKLKTLQGMMRKDKIHWANYSSKGKILLFGTKVLGVFRTKKGLIKSYNKASVRYNNQVTADKFISNDLFAVIDKPYKSGWSERVMLVPFEDRKYYIFEHYDSFLKVRYGDYMQLPPENERIPTHDIIVTNVD